MDPRLLAGAMIEALLGDATAAENIVRCWFRTVHRRSASIIPQLYRKEYLQQGPGESLLDPSDPIHRTARLLCYLARVPADVRIRAHRTAEANGKYSLGEGVRVFLFPFGGGPVPGEVQSADMGAERLEIAPHLMIPVEFMDPRLVQLCKVFVCRKGCLREATQDPTVGHVTFWSLAQHAEAQDAMDRVRPLLVVSALRAVLVDVRKWASHDREHSVANFNGKRQTGPVDAAAANLERRVISRLCSVICSQQKQRLQPGNGYHRVVAAHKLMQDAIEFMFTGLENARSLGRRDVRGVWRHIPNDAALERFAMECKEGWSLAIHP